MQNSRTGWVIVLIGVEIFIAAVIVAVLSGNSWAGISGLHAARSTPHVFDPVAAGPAPAVQIDDPYSRIVVAASTDGRVHVRDDSSGGGIVYSRHLPSALQVTRTPDGVKISRPDAGIHMFFAEWGDARVEVDVPPQSSLNVTECNGADVGGVAGTMSVHCTDGSIQARDAASDVTLSTADGSVELTGAHAGTVVLSSSDGSLRLSDVRAGSLTATTEDGSIRGQDVVVGGGRLATSDGSIALNGLGGNVTVSAHTDDGHVSFNGAQPADSSSDSNDATMRIGSGGKALALRTLDGSISITTNGAQ